MWQLHTTFLHISSSENESIIMDQAPPSSQGFAQISGWMTMELFKKYMKFVKPTINKPVLMIPDGHCSHTKSIDILD